jgi:hypothetical protein
MRLITVRYFCHFIPISVIMAPLIWHLINLSRTEAEVSECTVIIVYLHVFIRAIPVTLIKLFYERKYVFYDFKTKMIRKRFLANFIFHAFTKKKIHFLTKLWSVSYLFCPIKNSLRTWRHMPQRFRYILFRNSSIDSYTSWKLKM